MKHFLLPLCLASCLLFAFLSTACSSRGEGMGPGFRQVFYGDSLYQATEADTFTFRKVILGQDFASVKVTEGTLPPLHEDEFGLSYEVELDAQSVMLLDYYSGRDLQAGGNKRLISIVVDLILQDEVETARLYNDFESYLSDQYGLPDGPYGEQMWIGYTTFTNNMEVRLVLNENKRQITLNFVDLQTSTSNNSPLTLPGNDSP